MALDNVRIKIVVDDEAIKPTISKLEELGQVDTKNAQNAKKNADDFAAGQKKIQDSINKTGQDLGNVGKANKGAFATEQLNTFNDQLNKLNNTAGQSSQKFNTLQYSINNITREMPAFANSVQTGFMAISNNIPMVIDEITKLRKANQELAASGQPTNSVFKTLLGSIFSWGTALSVGVTLLTVYGGELAKIIGNLFSTSKALDINAKAFDNNTKAINQNRENLIKLQRASSDTQTEIEVLTGKLTEEEGRRLKANRDFNANEIELTKKHNQQKAELNKQINQALQNDIQKYGVQRNETIQKFIQENINLEKSQKSEREQLLADYNKKIELIELEEAAKRKARQKKDKKDETDIWEEALKEIDKATKEAGTIAEKDLKDRLKKETDARINAEKAAILRELENSDARLNAEIAAIEEEARLKILGVAHSEDAIFVITKETEEKIKQLRQKYRKDEQKALEEDLKRREELLERELKALEDAEKQKTELRTAQVNLAIDVAGSISNATFAIENQNATDRYNRRLKQLEEEKNAELNSKTLTEKQKIAIQERFDQETEQLQKQEFERQKNFKIAQAIINTALAVTNALATGVPPFNVIQAIAIGAQGAAQIAIIENEKFAKGGLVGGKLHSQGGTVIEAEKDEYVINRKDTMDNLELIENINKGKGEEFIFKKYVLPAVIGQKEAKAKESGLFAGIMDNMALNGKMFDDYYLRKAIEKSGKENAIMIVKGLKENTTLKNTRQF